MKSKSAILLTSVARVLKSSSIPLLNEVNSGKFLLSGRQAVFDNAFNLFACVKSYLQEIIKLKTFKNGHSFTGKYVNSF